MSYAVFIPGIEVVNEIGKTVRATPSLFLREGQAAAMKADFAIIANSFSR